MGILQRVIVGTGATVICLAMTSLPVLAATKTKPTTPPPTPPGVARKLAAALPPLVFQVNPTKVNPTKQPNIIIIGQHLSVRSTVQVGGRPATTIESPDPQTLLVQLPTNLVKGSYAVSVTNEAGTAVADDQLLVDDSGTAPSTLTAMAGAGFLLLFLLVARLARTPGLA
ncbi:MAG: IPT/TIG domain-containing protein [Candidatus Dormibacteraeota bacterium]|nr:IPT/TIG domain-containing protein [Candidatus Dormibacteraeota bacterium]